MAKEKEDNITGTDVAEAPQNEVKTEKPFVIPVLKSALKAPERESRIFKLSNDKRRGSVIMDMEEDVIDPKTNQSRRMRLLRGAQSIWMDEQSPAVYPPAYVAKNILTLTFTGGNLSVPVYETLKLQALELSNRNTGNPNKRGAKDIYFYEWNPVEQNKKAIDEENDVIKAMQIAMTAPIDEVVPHASYLNIHFSDEEGVPFDEEALRAAYIRKAKNEPTLFLNSAQSPTVKISYMVRLAVEGGKIDLGKQPGAAYWVDGGFISTLPQGRDAVDYLIEYAMTHGDSNTAFLNQLRQFNS